ncbi:MAG: hypothetical protein RSE54_07340 [Ruthenibacterium sp.]
MPGMVVGSLRAEIQKELGFDCAVMLPATHDTTSAFMAVPAKDENAVYISSGTWALATRTIEKPQRRPFLA